MGPCPQRNYHEAQGILPHSHTCLIPPHQRAEADCLRGPPWAEEDCLRCIYIYMSPHPPPRHACMHACMLAHQNYNHSMNVPAVVLANFDNPVTHQHTTHQKPSMCTIQGSTSPPCTPPSLKTAPPANACATSGPGRHDTAQIKY